MVFGWFRRRDNPAVAALYSAIVAQARLPYFYAELRVPDTVEARFDMIVLHAVLVFRRLRGEGDTASAFGQQVFDLFFTDMDGSLREMGVGDLSVPKKVKKMAEAFYGRAAAYSTALDNGDHDALSGALGRILFPDTPEPISADKIALYMEQSAAALARQPVADLLAGRVTWIDPAEDGGTA